MVAAELAPLLKVEGRHCTFTSTSCLVVVVYTEFIVTNRHRQNYLRRFVRSRRLSFAPRARGGGMGG